MPHSSDAPGPRLLRLWQRLSPLPGGAWLFSRALGVMVPYSGTVGALVEALEPGHARLRIRDRRRVRNHLHSVHAIAIANVGELASGLAVLTGLPPTVRGIVTGLDVRYLKKARGGLRAEAHVHVPTVTEPLEHTVTAEVFDAEGDAVATVTARWRLSPAQSDPSPSSG
ncbi:MAG: DUF4442 domain-containing protein [Gemmatimonadota bacterium]|nr:DUF4442 domain-containing protein [Gemmatimonadota bacterium]